MIRRPPRWSPALDLVAAALILGHNHPWVTVAGVSGLDDCRTLRRNCRAAVDDDRLTGDEGAGARCEHQRNAGDVFGLAEAA